MGRLSGRPLVALRCAILIKLCSTLIGNKYYISHAINCRNNSAVQIQFIVPRGRGFVDATQNNGVSVQRPFGICDIAAKIWAQLDIALHSLNIAYSPTSVAGTESDDAPGSCRGTPPVPLSCDFEYEIRACVIVMTCCDCRTQYIATI